MFFRTHLTPTLSAFVLLLAGHLCITAQSSDPGLPSPVTSNEISGVIKARDVGDARLTRYYFAFDGGQGDIFINVSTKNLAADIDIYIADGLKPLTKMVIYPESGLGETGRLIYLRKPENLILRIEGRSPGDDPATFRIKFAGSFIAKAALPGDDEQKAPGSVETEGTGIKVNSVGTIIETPPAEIPAAKPTLETAEKKPPIERPVYTRERVKPEVVVTSSVDDNPADTATPVTKSAKPPASAAKPPTAGTAKKPDPMENFRLVVTLKDGTPIEHAMTSVSRFSVERGQLVIIMKDGSITRYAMKDVAKMTLE